MAITNGSLLLFPLEERRIIQRCQEEGYYRLLNGTILDEKKFGKLKIEYIVSAGPGTPLSADGLFEYIYQHLDQEAPRKRLVIEREEEDAFDDHRFESFYDF